MQTIPETLAGRYELLDIIGRGGMGVVYRATDLVLHRTVAVKLLRSDSAADPTLVSRFEREAKAAGGLNHRNVVAIFDTGHEQGRHFIVMEHIAGRSLSQLLEENGPLPPERAVDIAAQIASALAAAHAAGIIHRDIKPANVMVDASGAVKVLDFGIARAVNGTTLTQAAMVLGSASYMAPEVIHGGIADERSDIYSLGCLLYELLTGRPPFTGENTAAIMHQHSAVPAQPPSRYNAEVGPALDRLVMQALSKRPDQRPRSARELRAAIEDSLRRAEPTLVYPAEIEADGGSEPTRVMARQPPRRRWAPRAAAVAALALVAAAVGLIAFSGSDLPRAAAKGNTTTHRRAARQRAKATTPRKKTVSSATTTSSVQTGTGGVQTGTGGVQTNGDQTGTVLPPSPATALAGLIEQELQSGAIDQHAEGFVRQLQSLLDSYGQLPAAQSAKALDQLTHQLSDLVAHGDISPSAAGAIIAAIQNLQAASGPAAGGPGAGGPSDGGKGHPGPGADPPAAGGQQQGQGDGGD